MPHVTTRYGPVCVFGGAVERHVDADRRGGHKFSALPEKVQKTIQATSPNIEIADISRHEDNGRVIYEIEFKDKGKNPACGSPLLMSNSQCNAWLSTPEVRIR